VIEALADPHVEASSNDVAESLVHVHTAKSMLESLAAIPDLDIERSLSHVASVRSAAQDCAADCMASYTVGTVTSNGQRFCVLWLHAWGGSGTVFVTVDAELNCKLALKQILDNHADDPMSRSRFLLEAQIIRGLEHPGIVLIYGLGTYGNGRSFYAVRFMRGGHHQGGRRLLPRR
jgi:eukaryotic-like serine/threonine-protein kinase